MKYTRKEAQDTATGLEGIKKLLNLDNPHLNAAIQEAQQAAKTPSSTLRDTHMARVVEHVSAWADRQGGRP